LFLTGQALRAGALGYVLKEAADTELVEALHAAIGGHRYLNAQLGARLAAESETIAGARLITSPAASSKC
jgi:two-component system response regulator NreC